MYTVLIIFLMLAGIVIGYAVFSKKHGARPLKVIGRTQQIATCALLFLMGIWLGGNETFWSDIQTIGIRGALFAVVTITASTLSAYMVSKFAFKKENTKTGVEQ